MKCPAAETPCITLSQRISQEPQKLLEHLPELLQILVQQAVAGRLRLRLPAGAGGYERLPGVPYHTWPELFFQLSGKGRFRCPGATLQCYAGDVAVVPPGTPHSEKLSNDHHSGPFQPRQLLFMCHEQEVGITLVGAGSQGQPMAEAFMQIHHGGARAVIGALSHALCQSAHLASHPQRQALASGLLSNFLAAGEHLVLNQRQDQQTPPTRDLSSRCLALIYNHLSDQRLSVRWIAERLGLNADYCSHQFAREQQATLSTTINQLRCQHAAHLLASSDLKIAAIAWSCGYADASYFARVFQAHHGLRPRAYRKVRLGSQLPA